MILRRAPSRVPLVKKGRFRENAVRISKFFVEIMKGQSKIIVLVIFHIDGDFNNLRK